MLARDSTSTCMCCSLYSIRRTNDDLENTIDPTVPDHSQSSVRESRGVPRKGFNDEYVIKEELGSGAFSKVYKCVHIVCSVPTLDHSLDQKTGVIYAVKIIQKQKMTQSDLENIRNEIYLLGTVCQSPLFFHSSSWIIPTLSNWKPSLMNLTTTTLSLNLLMV